MSAERETIQCETCGWTWFSNMRHVDAKPARRWLWRRIPASPASLACTCTKCGKPTLFPAGTVAIANDTNYTASFQSRSVAGDPR